MKRLDFYLGSTVAMTMSLSALGLVGMLTIFTFLEQMEDVRNNYTILSVGKFMLYSMPRLFYETVPYSALIGCLAGLGMLANASELLVIRAAGVSTWSIAWSAMKPALALAMVGLVIGEYVLPDFERIARIDRARAMSDENEITPKFGFWYREGNIYMHFDEVGQGGVLQGVSHFYFDEDDDRLMVKTMFADRAVFHEIESGGADNYWLLEDVTITVLGENRSSVQKLSSQQWDTKLTPDLLSTEILVQPDKMSIRELNTKIDYMRAEGLNSGKFELGLWGKVFQPLATIGLVLVAISFIFGPLRESTMGMRIVMGLIIGIAFKFIQDLLSPASLVFGFSPVIATLIPIGICFVVGVILLRRAG